MRKYIIEPVLRLFKRTRVVNEETNVTVASVLPQPAPMDPPMFQHFFNLPEDSSEFGNNSVLSEEDDSSDLLDDSQDLEDFKAEVIDRQSTEFNDGKEQGDLKDEEESYVVAVPSEVDDTEEAVLEQDITLTTNTASDLKELQPSEEKIPLVLKQGQTGNLIHKMAEKMEIQQTFGSGYDSVSLRNDFKAVMKMAIHEHIQPDLVLKRIEQETAQIGLDNTLIETFKEHSQSTLEVLAAEAAKQTPTNDTAHGRIIIAAEKAKLADKNNSAFSTIIKQINGLVDNKKINIDDIKRDLHETVKNIKGSSNYPEIANDIQYDKDHGKEVKNDIREKVITSIEKLDKLMNRLDKNSNGIVQSITKKQITQHLTEMKKDDRLISSLQSLDTNKPAAGKEIQREPPPSRPFR